MTPSSAQGACLCGAVRFSAALPAKWFALCHCSTSRRAHGAAFVTWVGFVADRVTIADDGGALRWSTSSPGAGRACRSRCGSPMSFRSERRPDELHIARALFSDASDMTPTVHVFYETHVSWASVDDALPKKRSQGS